MLDPVATERAEKEINKFITSRSKQREEANAVEALWRASERAHAAKQREENRAAWIDHYRRLAAINLRTARDYRARARRLEQGETA